MRWLIEGIIENIDPARCDLIFFFSNCEDDSKKNFEENKHLLSQFKLEVIEQNGKDLWELDNHNVIMKMFMDRPEYACLICPQDDNRINGKTLLDDLEKLFSVYGTTLGLVGGRDGYDFGYNNMAGSKHSRSTLKEKDLENGEWMECKSVNGGPMIYFRHVISMIGFNCEQNKMYAMDDYALRCGQAGLQNVVMGTDMIHQKFGKCKESNLPPEFSSYCLSMLNEKWHSILGRNVF